MDVACPQLQLLLVGPQDNDHTLGDGHDSSLTLGSSSSRRRGSYFCRGCNHQRRVVENTRGAAATRRRNAEMIQDIAQGIRDSAIAFMERIRSHLRPILAVVLGIVVALLF